ncbi:hypothetical protein C8R43DRAFT_1130063 [Mycena crocata]|nr:hypothetical protein C8R43DRAFT_1130063 [Mycena crocata]
MPFSPTHLWDPRTQSYTDDRILLDQEPIAGEFVKHQNARDSGRLIDKLLGNLFVALSTPDWVDVSTRWIEFCLGEEITSGLATRQDFTTSQKRLRIFLHVLWLRYRHGDTVQGQALVQSRLLDGRVELYNFLTASVPQVSLVRDLSLQDNLQFINGDESEEEEFDGEDSDDEFCGSFSPSGHIEGDDETKDPTYLAEDEEGAEISEDEVDAPTLEWRETGPYSWSAHIIQFFYPSDCQLEEPRSPKHIVDDLVQMRRIKADVYKSSGFLYVFEVSDLWRHLLNICLPGNLLETTHPDVELSFRYYNWRIAYGELLCRWTPPVRLQPLEITAKQPGAPFDPVSFLQFFSTNSHMHPWRSNPMAAYMFISASAFKVNCHIWLIPCLEALGFETTGWDLNQVYRDLMRHPVMQNQDGAGKILATLDERLRTVIIETANHRKLLKKVNEELFHPASPTDFDTIHSSPPSLLVKQAMVSASTCTSRRARNILSDASSTMTTTTTPMSKTQKKNRHHREKAKAKVKAANRVFAQLREPGDSAPASSSPSSSTTNDPSPVLPRNNCPGCKHKSPEDWCIRTIYVERNPSASNYTGFALTCAPEGDWLKAKKKKSKKSRIYKRTRYITPSELNMIWVEARPADHPVWTDCRRDIVRFMHRQDGTEYMVGGVRFHALTQETLKIMQTNHGLVPIRTIHRREEMAVWEYGTMTATGSRMPMGGIKGDGYAPYACHSGDTIDDIKALFRHATDTDILITAAKTIYTQLEQDLLQITEDSELNRFGRFGVTGFYCTNFLSCLHRDKDIVKDDRPTLHPCIQLSKENCGPNDYNFGMVEWGVAIRTEANTVWVFNGRDVHGTIMPSQSAFNNGAASKGKHDTNNTKDVNRATTCCEKCIFYWWEKHDWCVMCQLDFVLVSCHIIDCRLHPLPTLSASNLYSIMSTRHQYLQHVDPSDRNDVFKESLKYIAARKGLEKELDKSKEDNKALQDQVKSVKRRHNILMAHCIQAHGMQPPDKSHIGAYSEETIDLDEDLNNVDEMLTEWNLRKGLKYPPPEANAALHFQSGIADLLNVLLGPFKEKHWSTDWLQRESKILVARSVLLKQSSLVTVAAVEFVQQWTYYGTMVHHFMAVRMAVIVISCLAAMVYAAVLEHYLYKTSSCQDGEPSACVDTDDKPNPLSIFANIISLEYTYTIGYNCTRTDRDDKIHTMQGDLNPTPLGNPSANADISPRVLFRLFHHLESTSSDLSIKISYVELFNEQLRDLLATKLSAPAGNAQPMSMGKDTSAPKAPEGLKIFDDTFKHGVFIQGLEEIVIKDSAKALVLLDSSRSHWEF